MLLVPTIPATDATFLLPGVDRTQVCSILTPNVRSGTMRPPAAVFRARAFARSLRLTATVSVADEPPAAPVLPEPVRVATAAPAVARFPRIAVHWVPYHGVTGSDGAIRAAHRVRPSTGRLTGCGPLSSMVSTRAALLCR